MLSKASSPSVSYDKLQALQDRGEASPFLQARLDFQETQVLLNSHIAPLLNRQRVFPRMVNPQSSGRVGISEPPVGNYTADLFYGPHGLRDVVRPDRGCKWVAADWSAVEGWIVSHRCNDPVDLEAKQRGLDLHTVTAIHMFKYPDPSGEPTKAFLLSSEGEEWRLRTGFTKEIRDGVKNVRYTMQYAKQAHTVARYAVKLGLPGADLIRFAHLYLKSKPWLVKWKEARWTEAWRRKEARTAFGRRRRLLGDRYQCEKEGLNHEVQGTVADLMKQTMVLIAQRWPEAHMAYQQHDGWKTQVPNEWNDLDAYRAIVERQVMIDERPINFPCEMEVIRA